MNESEYKIHIRTAERPIVSINNFIIPHNEITFLFGESGIGKSLISKAIYGLLDPDELNIEINGQLYKYHVNRQWTKAIKQNSFFVFQEPSSHLNSLMKITDQLTEGTLKYSDDKKILQYLWQTTDDQSIKKIIDIYPKPYRPSGGEKQRVLLAMAFKKINTFMEHGGENTPTMFVFDEPTGSLDDNYRNLFLNLLFNQFERKQFTIILITHDYSIISEVYRKHKHLLNRIHFKELSRQDDYHITLHDFSADHYLQWLDEKTQKHAAQPRGEVVLEVDSNLSIFDRQLTIYKDEYYTEPANLTIRKGEMVYLKAPSGVGKTTLAKIIMGLYSPQQFRMTLDGMTVTERTSKAVWHKKIWGKKAGMVFQHADEALNLQVNVKEVFAGLPIQKKLTGDVLRLTLSELFEGDVTKSFLNKKVAFLSGGQKQRLNLLRTLIMDTDLIILDEPLNGLDFVSIKKVFDILEEKRRGGSALLLISHNEEIFDSLVDKEHVYYLS